MVLENADAPIDFVISKQIKRHKTNCSGGSHRGLYFHHTFQLNYLPNTKITLNDKLKRKCYHQQGLSFEKKNNPFGGHGSFIFHNAGGCVQQQKAHDGHHFKLKHHIECYAVSIAINII
mmetsp:Transcript_8116/g.16516  ORF Transcript_8116/g.16516 Transcript_8116/m.16516 type:complete len:119 (-) Transcript_8116:57-413(-)